jgi:predicted MFS family arabinose efflux permease
LIKSLSPNCVGVGVGILLLIHSIGASIGSYIGGILFEEQETYTNAVIICLVVCVAASIICFAIRETKVNDVDISNKK